MYFFLVKRRNFIDQWTRIKFISFKNKMNNWFFPTQKWETNYSYFSFSYERYQIFIDLLNSFSSIDRLIRKKKKLKIKDYYMYLWSYINHQWNKRIIQSLCIYRNIYSNVEADINFNRLNYQILFALQWLGKYQTILENLRYILSFLYSFKLLNLLFNLTNFTLLYIYE